MYIQDDAHNLNLDPVKLHFEGVALSTEKRVFINFFFWYHHPCIILIGQRSRIHFLVFIVGVNDSIDLNRFYNTTYNLLPVFKALHSSNPVSLGSKPETTLVPLPAAYVIVEADGYEFHDRRAQTHSSVHSVNPSWNQVRTRVSSSYAKGLPASRQHVRLLLDLRVDCVSRWSRL